MAAYDRIKCVKCVKNIYFALCQGRSHSRMFFQIDVLKSFANFTGKHQCWSLASNFIKNRCFPVKFANFLRAIILPNTSGGCF